jgi:hypothetical protein
MPWYKIKGRFLSAFMFVLFTPQSLSFEIDDQLSNQFVRVLHGQKSSNNLFKTEFTNRTLFSSSTQYFDPQEEIAATLTYLENLAKNNAVHQYYCEFPASYEILHTGSNKLFPADFDKCPDISAKLNNLQGLSVIFAAGYMGNPASYFGHMFIKLDQGNASLKSATFNIGAAVPENENPILYVLKGILGAYQTEYKETAYYKQAHSYSQLEGRDIYEYKLKLDAPKQRLLALHLLELENMSFTYYFTHKNCAYEILKFIQAIPDAPEMPFKPLFYPVHLIEYMQANGLIESSLYLPANKTQFSQLYHQLSQQQKAELQEALQRLSQNGISIRDVVGDINAEMAEVLVIYAYAHLDEELDKQFFNNIKRLRLSFPAKQQTHLKQFPKKELLSRSPIMVSTDYVQLNGLNGLNLTFRPAHYNQTDRPQDIAPGGKLIFFQADVLVSPILRLRKFDFVDVFKSEIGKTRLYGDDEHEWGLYAGYQSVYLDDQDFADLLSAKGYIGDNTHLGGSFWLQYGIEGGIRNSIEDFGSVHIAPKINIVGNLFSDVPVHLSFAYEMSRIGGQKNQIVYEISGFKQLSTRFGIQLKVAKDSFGETGSFGLNYYF